MANFSHLETLAQMREAAAVIRDLVLRTRQTVAETRVLIASSGPDSPDRAQPPLFARTKR